METTTRNADLNDLATLLKEQHGRKLDVVTPATSMWSINGTLHIDGTDTVPDPEQGFVTKSSPFVPTSIADEGIAEKLGVPVAYLKKLRQLRPDLYDANVNGWLQGVEMSHLDGDGRRVYEGADPRNFLVRCFRGDEGTGIARAFLSDGYKIIDNLDVLTAALEGVSEAGVKVDIEGCDLTERRMHVRIIAPEVQALAPSLLRGYRSPFDNGVQRAGEGIGRVRALAASEGMGYEAGQEPVVFAGFIISNSETGGGAFTITPRLIVKICRNGLMITRDATRAIHLGSKMDEGVIRWSEDTQEKNLALVAAKARDAVATYLDVDYMRQVIERLEEKAATPLANPAEQVKLIGQTLRFSEDRTDGILDHFIRAGQVTAGGVLNAVTSFAQTLEDADEAFEVESVGIRALELAATR